MRTNIELNEDLVSEAMQYSSARTKRALIEQALQTFIRVEDEKRKRQTYAQRLDEVRSRSAGIVLRERPLDVLRSDRARR